MKDKLFLKECLADALISLMEEKPYDTISIIDITKKANISRATYYRHFSSKEDLIQFKITLLFQHFDAYIREHNIRDPYKVAVMFFHFIYRQKKLLITLQHAELYHVMHQFLIEYLQTESKSLYDEYKNTGVSFFIIGIVNAWIEHDFKETPEQLSTMMQQIVKDITY